MVKVISLSNEAYEKLKALKGEKSFSKVVIEITANKKKRSIMDFAGAWKNNSEYWTNFEKQIRKDREKAKLRNY